MIFKIRFKNVSPDEKYELTLPGDTSPATGFSWSFFTDYFVKYLKCREKYPQYKWRVKK